ncbi:NSS family neurotransmitter:Na+ symporter [Desulfitispora alkaliphila]|uniref:sodium-dependent transporter n=1 Tax=Desulfitispora alkaliphila TaxID=622674 RepID=UPI003D1B6167
MEQNARENWGSRLGFILAAAGSAIGLGNIWRFSYTTGEHGGAAFLFIYLIAILLIGYPLMATEIAIGRKTQKNPIGALSTLAPNTPWWFVGALGVFAGIIILSFYSVISGWALAYTFKSLVGFVPNTNFEVMFDNHITSVWEPILWHAIFMGFTLAIIAGGVVKGIQRWAKILMPLLFILLIALVIRGITLPNAWEGIEYLFRPDFTAVTGTTVLAAIGQAFFTLSLGMGTLVTYGSYLKRDENIINSTGWIIGLDTFVAILAGIAIFPAVFSLGFSPDSGPGLAFITLPAVFASMTGGQIFGFLFFLLLSVAALTSAISLLEVVVAWLIDEKGWTRNKASLLMGIFIFLVGIPTTLGNSLWQSITILNMSILDFYDFISGNIILPLGGMLFSIFSGYIWGAVNTRNEINNPKGWFDFGAWYEILIKYIIPISIFIVMVVGLIDSFK